MPSDSYTSLKRLGSCDCTSKATLFVGEQALLRHASLPSSVGGSISWVDGYAVTADQTTPTASASPSETATVGSVAAGFTALPTTAAATSIAAFTQAPGSGSGSGSDNSSLSMGAKAGIAVGSIGAAMSVLAIAVVVFLHRRKKRGGQTEHSKAPSQDDSPEPPTPMVDGNDCMAPPAYSGHKAELSGDGVTVNTQLMTPRIRSSPSAVTSPALTPEMAHSEFGERRMSLVSELSNNDDGQRGVYTIAPPGGMTPIAELQG